MTNTASTVAVSLLGVPVAISAPPPLFTRLTAELAPLLGNPVEAPVDGLGLNANGTVEDTVEAGPTSGHAVQNALAEITRFAVTRSPMLCIHAGVVAGPGGLVAIPGRSGHGKTTLVAALVQAGFGYVSDEVLALDRASLTAAAFPRPLALDRESWRVLGLDPDAAPPPGAEALVAPHALGDLGLPGPVTDIVLSQRRSEGLAITPTHRGAAVAPLLAQAFNHYLDPAESFRAVVALVRGARVWTASYTDAPELATALAGRLGNS